LSLAARPVIGRRQILVIRAPIDTAWAGLLAAGFGWAPPRPGSVRAHRAHRPAGPVRAVRRAGRDRGARPGRARNPKPRAATQITTIRSPPLTLMAATLGRTQSCREKARLP